MPDYIAGSSSNLKINIELKTISVADPGRKFKIYQKDTLESKIQVERILCSEIDEVPKPVVFSKFSKVGSNEPLTRTEIVRTLLNKVKDNYEPAQLNYQGNRGVLFVDTAVLKFPYYPQEALPLSLHPPCDHTGGFLVSGCLWNACFAQEGATSFEYIKQGGSIKLGSKFTINGLLTGGIPLEAVVFIMRPGGYEKGKMMLLGFYNSATTDIKTKEFLDEVCDFVNDKQNTGGKILSFKPYA